MPSLRIIFASSGSFGAPTLLKLLESGHAVVKVFTQPDRPAGRGRQPAPTPIARVALDRGLDVQPTPDINRETLPPADLLVVIAFGQKIAQTIALQPRLGAINLHASLLPRYRGAAPINWAILRGETITGNSVIRLAERMDAGAILGQSSLAISDLETAGELHDRLAGAGAVLVMKVIEELQSGKAVESPQDESQATTAGKLNRELSRIDWTHDAGGIARQIRGLHPWPGCRVRLLDAAGGELTGMTLIRAVPTTGEGSRWTPGEIMSDGHVAAGSGGVQIIELQPEGRKPMKLEDYRRGNPWQPGMRLQSL